MYTSLKVCTFLKEIGLCMTSNKPRHEKTNTRFPNRSDTNRTVKVQKMARDWKFWF